MKILAKILIFLIVASFPLTVIANKAEAKKKYTIAVIRWDPNDIYFNGVQYGQELERDKIMAEEGVEIEFKVFGANDSSKQVTALQQIMDVGIDGAMIVAWKSASMAASVEELNKRNIPVVAHNNYIPGSNIAFVAFDNYGAGVKAGEYALDRLNTLKGEKWAEKGGVIIELRCILTISPDIDRHNGYHTVFDPILEKNPNIKWETTEAFCDGSKARKFVDDMISRHGPDNILAVLSIDGTMGVGGAVPALDAQGILYPANDPRHIPIVTVDGTQVEFEAINRGDTDFCAVQPATGEGIMAMRVLWNMIKQGKQLEKPSETTTIYKDGSELWMPVDVIPGEGFNGPWYKLQTYGVPSDSKVDNETNWANVMYKVEKGSFPKYSGAYGK